MRAKLLFLTALLLVAALTAPAAFGGNGGFAPVTPESPNAEGIRDSYLFVSIFVLGIFVLVEGLLIAFLIKGIKGAFQLVGDTPRQFNPTGRDGEIQIVRLTPEQGIPDSAADQVDFLAGRQRFLH